VVAAPAGAAAREGVFFPIAPGYRVLLVLAYLAYLGWAGYAGAVNHVPASFVMWVSLAIYVLMRLVPLVFYRDDQSGWFHPLVFSSLFALPYLLREAPAFAVGMRVHAALPGRTPWELDRLYAYELVLTSVGLAFYYLGFYIPRVPPVPRLRFGPVRWLRTKALFATAVAGVVLLAFVARRGGLIAHMLSWARGRTVGLAGEGYWLWFALVGGAAVFIWFALDRRAMRQPVFWAAVLAVSAFNFIASGSRSAVILPVLSAFMLWVFRERKIPVVRGAALMVAGMMTLGALGAVRLSTWKGSVDWGAAFASRDTDGGQGVASELAGRSLQWRGTTAILGRVPREDNYIYGSSFAALLTLPVPRKLWPGKPVQVGGRMGRTFYDVTAGMPPGIIGEAYWNFGLLGIPLVFFCFGMFHRWLANFIRCYPREPVAMAIYVTLVLLAQPSSGGILATLLKSSPLFLLAVLFGAMKLRTAPGPGAPAALAPAPAGGA
jgi:oligosaccharide repeat unit polymerase